MRLQACEAWWQIDGGHVQNLCFTCLDGQCQHNVGDGLGSHWIEARAA